MAKSGQIQGFLMKLLTKSAFFQFLDEQKMAFWRQNPKGLLINKPK